MILASDFTATDLAAVILAVASVVAVVLLVFVVVSVTRTLTAVRLSVEQVRREALPVIAQLEDTVRQANAELVRVDGLLDSASSVTATVDAASRLAFLAVSNPAIKVAALATGAARTARSFRKKP